MFYDIHLGEADGEFEKFLQTRRGRTQEENLSFKYRFLHKSYLNKSKSFDYTQEAVIKIINSGRGKKHLRILMRYIERDLSKQSDEKKVDIYNSEGIVLKDEEKEKFTQSFSKDFVNIYDNNLTKKEIEALEELEKGQSILNDKHFSSGLNDTERQYFLNSKIFTDNSQGLDRNFAYAADVAKHGFVISDKNESHSFVYLDDDLEVKKRDVSSIGEIEYIGSKILKKKKLMPRDFLHMVISPGGDNPNKAASLQATKNFLEENFKSKGYEYFYAMHEDKKNLHFHVVVKTQSKQKSYRPKLNLNKFALHALRLDYTAALDGYGINRNATLHFDRAEYLEQLKQKSHRLKGHNADWFNYKLSESENYKNFDILKFRRTALQQIDYLTEKYARMGMHNEARILKKEKKRYELATPENISKVATMTELNIKESNKDLARTFSEEFSEGLMNEREAFFTDKKTQEKVVSAYKEHLDKTISDLQKLKNKDLSEEIYRRKQEALSYLKDTRQELDYAFDKKKDTGRSMQRMRDRTTENNEE